MLHPKEYNADTKCARHYWQFQVELRGRPAKSRAKKLWEFHYGARGVCGVCACVFVCIGANISVDACILIN